MTVPLPSRLIPEVSTQTIRRFREAGDLTLDLHHYDGRIDDRWLGLTPCEFGMLWRLAEVPGERVTAGELLVEVCLVAIGPVCGEVAAEIAGARAKLAAAGLAQLVGGDAAGGYLLDVPPARDLMRIG